jgi:hypothetical protein
MRILRVICWLKGHQMTRSILQWAPAGNGTHAVVSWHYNCLRCPHKYQHDIKVPYAFRTDGSIS